jgi:spore germination protein GerM
MTSVKRYFVLTLLAMGLVGVSSWLLIRDYLGRTAPEVVPASGAAPQAASGERRIKVTLYYVAEDGSRLVPMEKDVPFAEGTSDQARRILEAQLLPPPAPLLTAIPTATTLRGIYIGNAGEAYADFGGGLRTSHPGGSLNELFTVYAIVSALTTNLPAIKSVQILVDGHEVDTLAGHVDLRRPLPRSAQWLEPPAVR